MINGVTLKVNVDDYILNTLKEDITSEDVSTNAVTPEDKQGKAELICSKTVLSAVSVSLKERLNFLIKLLALKHISRTATRLKRVSFWALFTAI